MTYHLARVIDAYGKTPDADTASYVLFRDDEPVRWLFEHEVTELVRQYHEGKPARHWQVATKDGTLHDYPEAVECRLGQAWGVGPWLYKLTDTEGGTVAEHPSETVHYTRQV
ncbi:hypothetical protein [Sinomonas sp.]|uniref:hypothetical protein n=1 Tax=Sinomonas sp. TaxID=1914986 RepID=UPI003F7EB58B